MLLALHSFVRIQGMEPVKQAWAAHRQTVKKTVFLLAPDKQNMGQTCKYSSILGWEFLR